jgi:hypothetical protein
MTENHDHQPDSAAPDPLVVRRDQCNGRTLACANCNRLHGDAHHFTCYAYALARQEAERDRAKSE